MIVTGLYVSVGPPSALVASEWARKFTYKPVTITKFEPKTRVY